MISIHMYSLKVVAVASFCSYSLCSSAQQLQAGNIDEVVKAMALEEKCHFVLGCGMHFNDEAKFPGTAGSTFGVARLGIPETYCADSPGIVRPPLRLVRASATRCVSLVSTGSSHLP